MFNKYLGDIICIVTSLPLIWEQALQSYPPMLTVCEYVGRMNCVFPLPFTSDVCFSVGDGRVNDILALNNIRDINTFDQALRG